MVFESKMLFKYKKIDINKFINLETITPLKWWYIYDWTIGCRHRDRDCMGVEITPSYANKMREKKHHTVGTVPTIEKS